MASFIAMRPEGAKDRGTAVLVRDGFSYLGFLVPVLWLAWHRLWIEAAFALAASLALTALGALAGLSTAASLLSVLISIYVGLEGAALRIWALRRNGWREVGVFEADNRGEAEIRYLADAGLLEGGAEPADLRPSTIPGWGQSRSGLLLNPGN